ncbi:MAG: hypothetical protein E6R13_04645 [Spirochaetes bacterium]|nr:MAG: hypothetical protein E6R13_04645 [Spirochaetota bacterium]
MYQLANSFEETNNLGQVQNDKQINTSYEQPEESYSEYTIGSLVSCLFEMRDNMHIQHFKTTSYATHMALDTLYKDIVDLVDSLVESWQGKYGIISGYTPIEIHEELDAVEYLKYKLEYITEFRGTTKDSYILSQLDIIEELIYSSLYKLQNLN